MDWKSTYLYCNTMILFVVSLMFISAKSLTIMLLLLVMMVIMTAYSLCVSSLTVWFSYILVMIWVGALMILFSYMAALTPNVGGGKSVFFPLVLTPLFLFMKQPVVETSCLEEFPPLIILLAGVYLTMGILIATNIFMKVSGPLRV